MAQFYTLEEAARVLGMSPEELKAKAQHREVRAFLDGGSWRFRVVDVDELARRSGLGSDAELRLSDHDLPSSGSGSQTSDDAELSEFDMGVAKADLGPQTMSLPQSGSGSDHDIFLDDASLSSKPGGGSAPISGSGSDHDILLDDMSLPPHTAGASSSVIIGMEQKGRSPSSSDVQLVPEKPKGPSPSDSDVRLAAPVPPGVKKASDSDVTLLAEETVAHKKVVTPGPSDTSIRQSPASRRTPSPDDDDADSDFELTPSGSIVSPPDMGSDFELTAAGSGDDFESTPKRKPSDSDVTAADPGFSGINLSRPSDSGINLQMASGLNLNQGDSIELAPLSGVDMTYGKPAAKAPQAKAPEAKPAAKSKPKPDMAATPLPSGSGVGKNIFEDTDFEVDALDSEGGEDDKTVQLEAASDFELEEGDSDTGSEVFAIDEEDVDQNAATTLGAASSAITEEDDEEEDAFAADAEGEMASAWDVESETPSQVERSGPAPVLATAQATPEWGGLWVGLLGVTTLFVLFLAFVSMDLVRNLYEFNGDSPASGLIKSIAGMIGG